MIDPALQKRETAVAAPAEGTPLGGRWKMALVGCGFLLAFLGYSWLFVSTEVFPTGGAAGGGLTRLDLQLLLLTNPMESITGWYAGDAGHFGMVHRWGVLLVAGLVVASAYCLGQYVLTRSRDSCGLSSLEQLAFATALGLGIFSLFTFAVGLAGGLQQRWLFWLAMLAPLAGNAAISARAWRSAVQSAWKGARFRLRLSASWLVAPVVVFVLLGATLPPWEFDVCEYHLQVPKEWFQQGRITFLPHNAYGNMPMAAELHAVIGMALVPGSQSWWWGALVGKVVLAVYALLTALVLVAAGRRFACAETGVLAALVFITTPWVAYVSMAGLVEVVWGCYLILAVYATLLWSGWRRMNWQDAEPHRAQEDQPGQVAGGRSVHLLLAGAMAGIASACKYPALLLVIGPLVVWVFFAQRRFAWKSCTLFLAAAFVFVGPWLVKNWLLAENPVYPLMGTLWTGRDRATQSDARWRRAHASGEVSIAEFQRAASGLMWKSRWQSPILVPFVVLAVLAAYRCRGLIPLLAFTAFYLACWWLFTHRIERFWVPLLPLLAWLAGLGASFLQRVTGRWLVRIVVVSGVMWTLPWIMSGLIGDSRVLVSLEKLRQGEVPPLAGRTPRWSAFEYLQRNLSPGQRVLLVGEARVFQANFPVLYNTCFDSCRLEQLLANKSRAGRLAALHAAGIAYVLVHWEELERYRAPGNYGYSEFATRPLVHEELVRQQALLRPVAIGVPPRTIELFQVRVD